MPGLLRICALLLGLLAVACRPVSDEIRQTDGVGIDNQVKAQSDVYRVDGGDIRLLVYKAGALARLGHNHVISAPRIRGTVYRHPNLSQSAFELQLEVAELVIDDANLRTEEGEEFSSVPSDADIAGTRRNMLAERLLDGERFPTISITGAGLTGSENRHRTKLQLHLKGGTFAKEVPIHLVIDNDRISVTSEFDLTHGEIGLEPFSVMLGALQVADQMRVKLQLDARLDKS